jgi:hypothetical protein
MWKFEEIALWKRKIVRRSELEIHKAVGRSEPEIQLKVGIIRLKNKRIRGAKSSSAETNQNPTRRDQSPKRRDQSPKRRDQSLKRRDQI